MATSSSWRCNRYTYRKLGKWRREDLPILPEQWKTTVMRDKSQQFEILRGLMQRSDVGEVVNACDAGREGELIFRLVYEESGLHQACETPVAQLDGARRDTQSVCKYAPGR